MHITVNGVKLFVDIEGAGLATDGMMHAGEADACAVARRTWFRSYGIQAALLATDGHLPDRLRRSSRQRPERGRRHLDLEPGAMGRRRQNALRYARHRETCRLWRIVRRLRRPIIRDATPRPSFQARPGDDGCPNELSDGFRGLRAARRQGSARGGGSLLDDADAGAACALHRALPSALQRARNGRSGLQEALNREDARVDALQWTSE